MKFNDIPKEAIPMNIILSAMLEDQCEEVQRVVMGFLPALKRDFAAYQRNPHNQISGLDTIWTTLSGYDLRRAIGREATKCITQ